MILLNIVSLFRTILILIGFYVLFKIVARVLLPALLRSFINKKTAEFQNRQNPHEKSKKEGEISIDYIPKKNTKRDDGSGEYVDYEEVK